MGEFFKQLISQLSDIWQKLSLQQRVIISSLLVFMAMGLFTLLFWSSGGSSSKGDMKLLFRNVSTEEMADVVEQLETAEFEPELRNDGRDVYVKNEVYYKAKMLLAREGLPAGSTNGYELFDKNSFGMTDFEQNIKARRALEGELTRTIEALDKISRARVHLVFMKNTLFNSDDKAAKASITLKMRGAGSLSKDQIRGISFLVSSSVEGLKRKNVSILDSKGRLLSSAYGEDEPAGVSARNIEIESQVEKQLAGKVERLLNRVVGPGNASITVDADLDFDRIEKTSDIFDPESRVVRSEEISETAIENAPDGDQETENIVSNYEINKTVEHVVKEIGNVKRLSVAVVVNGTYSENDEGEEVFVPRSQEELTGFEDAIKSAVGFDLARGDQISVESMQFDNSFERQFETETAQAGFKTRDIVNYSILAGIILAAVIVIVNIGKAMAEAMNPPMPEVELPKDIKDEEEIVEIPENVARSNELLEKAEVMAENDPDNVAKIIRDWLSEGHVGGREKA
ncbi:MAG: flagellar basal-body MS-ring/collar protein FliF [Fibrobacterota bacterium]